MRKLSGIIAALIVCFAVPVSASTLCGVDLKPWPKVEVVRRQVEDHYTQINCGTTDGPSGSVITNGVPVIRFSTKDPEGERPQVVLHELLHMQLWVHGFPPNEHCAQDALGGQINADDPREAWCRKLDDVLLHKAFITKRLKALGFDEAPTVRAHVRAMLKEYESKISEIKSNEARDNSIISFKIHPTPSALEVIDLNYRVPNAADPITDFYRRLNFTKAIELQDKLTKLINERNPTTYLSLEKTIKEGMGIICLSPQDYAAAVELRAGL